MTQSTWLLATICIAAYSSLTSASTPCPRVLTVDITAGRNQFSDYIYWDGVLFPKDKYFSEYLNGSERFFGCICDIKPCFRKCCPFGHAFRGNSTNSQCRPSDHELSVNFTVPVYNLTQELSVKDDYFHVIANSFCKEASYRLNPREYGEDTHMLQLNGSLYQNYSGFYHLPEYFCLEVFEEEDSILPLVCFPDDNNNHKRDDLYSTGKIF